MNPMHAFYLFRSNQIKIKTLTLRGYILVEKLNFTIKQYV